MPETVGKHLRTATNVIRGEDGTSTESAPAPRERFLKARDSWLDVLVLERLAVPLTRSLARLRFVTPTRVSLCSIAMRLGAVALFSESHLRLGGVVYVVGLLLDGVDGKLARLTGRTSARGALLDYSADFALFALLVFGLHRGVGGSETPFIICIALGVASAFAKGEDRGEQGHETTRGATVARSAFARWDDFAAAHRIVALPGVVEAHAILFCVAPLAGTAAVRPAIALGAVYFGLAWIAKLLAVPEAPRVA